jgi:hypothetical protein
MYAIRAGLILALVLRAEPGKAQDAPRPLGVEEAAVATATFEWFAKRIVEFSEYPSHEQAAPNLYSEHGTLLLSARTRGRLPGLASAGLAGGPSDERSLTVSDALIQRLEAVSGVEVVVCDMYADRLEPCGVKGRWIWLVLSNAAVADDRAVIFLEERWVERGPPPASDVDRMGANWAITLLWNGVSWTVDSARIVGVS